MRLIFAHNHPIWDPRSGGGQRVNHELACHAVAAGHEVLVVHLGGASDPGGTSYDTLTVPETGRLLVDAWRYSRAVVQAAAKASAHAVSLSAAHGAWAAAAVSRGTGVVATLHHPDPPPLPRLAWRRPLRSMRGARAHQEHLLLARLLRRADAVTVPSSWSRSVVYERGYLPATRDVLVVPNGVDEAWMEVGRSRVGAPPGPVPPHVVVWGRLDGQKGIDTLLQALHRSEGGDITCTVAGEGPEGIRLRASTQEMGLGDRVEFVGNRGHDGLRALAREGGAFVLPSRHESFGLAILEAMAAGLPVVTTAVGGITDFARHEYNALLVPPDDAPALAAALHRVLRDDDLRRALTRGGLETAERHRWSHVAPAFLDVMATTAEEAGAFRGGEKPG